MTTFSQCYLCEVYQIKSLLNVVKCSTNRQHYVRGWKIWWKVKFIVALWSHHHYKQSKLWPLLGISILYTGGIRRIVPSCRCKGVIANQDHTYDFLITHLSQLQIITEVHRKCRKSGLSSSSSTEIIFSPFLKVHPNFEPLVICILGVWFTWDLKWYVGHILVIASLYLKVSYTIENKSCLMSKNIWLVTSNFINPIN